MAEHWLVCRRGRIEDPDAFSVHWTPRERMAEIVKDGLLARHNVCSADFVMALASGTETYGGWRIYKVAAALGEGMRRLLIRQRSAARLRARGRTE